MSVIRKLAAAVSLVGLTLVTLGVHGCPVLDGDPELEPGEYPLGIAAILEGGLRILVEIAQPAITPQRIQVGLPIPFSSFGQEQIGALVINEDLVGAFERKFNILRTDETRFYIDFNNFGTFDSNEINGELVSSDNGLMGESAAPSQLNITYPEDSHSTAGLFSFVIDLDILAPLTGLDEFAFNVPIDIFFDDLSLQVPRNLLLLINAHVLPHIPFGADNLLTIEIDNPHGLPVDVDFAFFDVATGGALPVQINQIFDSNHRFMVPAYSSLQLDVRGSGDNAPADSNPNLEVNDNGGDLQVAWALVRGSQPVSVSTIYSTFENESAASRGSQLQGPAAPIRTLAGEAGIRASEVSTSHVLNVNRTAEGFDTAFAVVNPTDQTANLTISLKDSEEVEVAQKSLALAPGTQTAQFVLPFFELEAEVFSGSAVIVSDTDVAGMSLRTQNGIQRSNLSSGSFAAGGN